jgi:hypothetical protein
MTDIHHEPGVHELLSKVKTGSANGRVSSIDVDGAFFKYEDLDSGILNYTFLLPDDSPDYFENLVLCKYDDGFYGSVYRYIPDGVHSTDGSFQGTIEQFDLEGQQIAEFPIPFMRDSIHAHGRVQMLNQCVKSIEQNCVTTYKVESVTDYPCHCQYDRKTKLGSVCTFSFNMGMCDDMITEPPAGGGGTYVGAGNGPSPLAGGGGSGGTVAPKPAPKKPIVVYVPENDIYIGDKCVACIENQLRDPCLKMVAKKVLDPAIASKYNTLIQDIFNKNDKVNLIIREGDAKDLQDPEYAVANGWAEPPQSHDGIVDVAIKLNLKNLAGASQEYVASTIYHESFHAIVNYFDRDKWFKNTATDDHIAIFGIYLDLIAEGLQKAYPNLSSREAQGLILKGMLKYEKDWGELFNKLLIKKGFKTGELEGIERRYKNAVSGTSCSN